MSVIFKIAYDTDIRRVSVASNTSFNEFNELVRKLFIESIPDTYVIKYTDDEGDLVSITCDREFSEAFAFATGKPLLRLTIVAVKPKVASQPAPVPTPTKEEPRRAVPSTLLNFNADPIVGIIEQALDCPELQGLINHFGVSIENVKNIVNGLKQDVAEALEKGKEKVKEGEKEESDNSEQSVHQAYCDHCQKQIVGIRYKCTICCDFDLCSTCEALLPSASVHDTQHLFLKVFKPASLPCRRPLLRNFYAEPAGSCPYAGRRWGGGPGCRGPWAGRRWGGPGCHQWRQNQDNATPAQPSAEGTPVTETCRRWQPRGQNWMSSRFIADVTINDGSQMEPGVPFRKVWRLKNTGTVAWPEGTSLSFAAGDVLGGQDNVILGRVVQPDEEIDVGVDMIAPSKPGRYISNFRLVNPEGISFGHRVWADILVIPAATPVEEEKKVEHLPPQPCTIVIEKKVEEPVVVEEKKAEPVPVVEEKKEELPEKKEEEEEKGYIYAEQLAALLAMGFADRQANKAALAKRKGNVIAAVNDLLN